MYRPSVSVSSTSRSAFTRSATWAAKVSLSPKRSSSVEVVSFSLMIGTTCQSSRRLSVLRAFRYCVRAATSKAVSSTWAVTTFSWAKRSV